MSELYHAVKGRDASQTHGHSDFSSELDYKVIITDDGPVSLGSQSSGADSS